MTLTCGLNDKHTDYSRMTQITNRFARSCGRFALCLLALNFLNPKALEAETLSLNGSGDFTGEFTQRAGSGDNRFDEAASIGVSGSRAIRRSDSGTDQVAYTRDTSLSSMLDQASVSIKFNYSTNATGSGGVPLFVGVSTNSAFDGSETGTSGDDFAGVELSQRITGSNESKLTLFNGIDGSRAQTVDSGFENLTPGWYEIEMSMVRVDGLLDLSVSLHSLSANGSSRTEENVITGAISSLTNVDLLGASDIYLYLGGSDTLNRGVIALDDIAFTGFGTPVLSAPTNLVAQTISQTEIDLSWIDNSSSESGFKIERRTGSGSWSDVAEVSANTTTYSDSGLAMETSYTFRVSSVGFDTASSPSNEASATTAGNSAPPAPTSLVAQAVSQTQINLSWIDNSSNETGFKIERRVSSGSWSDLIEVSANSTNFSDTGLSSETNYTYRVTALGGGIDSSPSNEANATTEGVSAPAAPSSLIAQAVSGSQINLSWSDNSFNEVGFRIERRTQSGSWSNLVDVAANSTSYSNTGLTGDTYYIYRVSAIGEGAVSDPSGEAHAATNGASVPSIPANLTAVQASITQIDLSWSDVSNDETYFRIERRIDDGPFQLLEDLTADSVSYSDINLAPGFTYTYLIRSGNGAGLSNASNEASVFISNTSGMNPPSNLVALAPTSAEVSLTWSDNTNEETGYRIERKSGDGSYFTIVNVGSNVTSFTDQTVMPLTSYTYRVAGIRFEQFSEYSNESTVNTPALEPPLSPTSLAIGGQGLDYVILGWTDRSSNETGYRLERKTGDGGFELLAELEPESTFYVDNQVTELGMYAYRVFSFNDAGNSNSSNEVSTQIEFDHPTDLVALAISSEQVDLNWNDNSSAETSYRVERRVAQGVFEELVTLPANSKVYSDTDVDPISTYTYRVIATDGVTDSNPTNEASASTPNIPAPGSPDNLLANLIDASYVVLSWSDNSLTESGFRIERMVGEGGWSELFTVPANTTVFQDPEVGELESFSYRVVSFNDGGESSFTNVASVAFPFNAPSNLVAQSSGPNRVDLTWEDNSLVESGYRIERKAADGEFEAIHTTGIGFTAYVDDSAETAVSYTYRVVGIYEGGESNPTNEASATTSSDETKPDAPTGLAATPVDFDQIHLTWTDTSDNESGFRIERSTGEPAEFMFVGNVPADSTYFTDNDLLPETEYSYRIAAYINGASTSELSNEASATTLTIPLPEMPTDLMVASQTLSLVSLSWIDQSDVEEGFIIQRKTGEGDFEVLATVNENVTYFNDSEVQEREIYTYRVLAYNDGGETAPTNEVVADIPFAPPQLLVGDATSFNEVELNWLDVSTVETGFRIERKPDGGLWGVLGIIGENTVIFSDTSPEPNTTYSYRVFAILNGEESEPSNVVNVTTPNIPVPDAPSNLVIESLSPTSISLTWQDNSLNEDGFRIFRKELNGGVWVQIDEVVANVNLYVDETAIAGLNYAYSIAAFNEAGAEEPVESEFRNPIQSRLINISTRGLVETDDNVMIGSFIIRGDGPKTVLIRGIGPSLQGTINAPVLNDPQLTLVSGADLNNPIAYNDDWRDTDEAGIIAAGLPPSFDSEAAIVIRLEPGAYSAILSGVNYSTGFGLVEIYEVDYSKNIRIINISTRTFVESNDRRMIGGFVIRGDTPARVYIRVTGPSLPGTIENRLLDPTLELFMGQELIDSNDNWKTSPQISEIFFSGIPPSDDREPAIVATLEPGIYTAVVGGAGNSSGYGLLEIYDYPE